MSLGKGIHCRCPSSGFRHRCLVPLSTEREVPLEENQSRNFGAPSCTWRNLFLPWCLGRQTKPDSSCLKLAHVFFLHVLEAPHRPMLLLRSRRAAISSDLSRKSGIWVQKKKQELKSGKAQSKVYLPGMMRVVKEWGHSLSRASRAVRAQHRVEDNELRHWAKQRQLYCLQELSWCLCTTLHSPVWCCGSLNDITLCNADDPRDLSTVSFKEKLSQHELCDLRDVKPWGPAAIFKWGRTDNSSRWPRTDTFHFQSKASLCRILIRAAPVPRKWDVYLQFCIMFP